MWYKCITSCRAVQIFIVTYSFILQVIFYSCYTFSCSGLKVTWMVVICFSFLVMHVIWHYVSWLKTVCNFDIFVKLVFFISPQVLQEVLSLYSVPETSFAKACIIIDKVSDAYMSTYECNIRSTLFFLFSSTSTNNNGFYLLELALQK